MHSEGVLRADGGEDTGGPGRRVNNAHPLVLRLSFSSLLSLSLQRDDNRINVSLGFRQRTDQIHTRGVETPDWLLHLTEWRRGAGGVERLGGGWWGGGVVGWWD